MKLTEEDVRRVAELASLRLTEEEVGRMARDLDEIITHVDKLSELDTSMVEPLAQVLVEADENAALRTDLDRPPLGPELALRNAPVKGSGYFRVPKIIER